ncbi:MAG TPA: BREX-1 system phosphatase PglZ type A [Prolixibacteraceae bacterium]|nr:BREX-1 system phosphatase PglZ type A [Prolixibacteraceae bacterium]
MLNDKIISTLTKYPEVRVIFFFDPDRDSEEEVSALNSDLFKVEFFQNNPLNLKMKFRDELADDKVFLYLPIKRPETHQEYLRFPLLDLLIANRELRLDDVGEFMDTFKLKPHQRSLVDKYIRELKYESVQKVIAPVLKSSNFEEKPLQRALISAFLRFQKPESTELMLAKLITLGLDSEDTELKRFSNKISTNGLMSVLDDWSLEYIGEQVIELTTERLSLLASRMKYNALVSELEIKKTIDPYVSLHIGDPVKRNLVSNLIETASRNSAVREKFLLALDKLTQKVREQKLVELYGVSAPYSWINQPLVKEIQTSIVRLFLDGKGNNIDTLNRISIWEDLSGNLKLVNQFLLHTLNALEKITSAGTVILDKPEEYIRIYCESWYVVDTEYRKSIVAWKNIDFAELSGQESFERLKDNIEKRYVGFLESTNREWLKCLSEGGFDYSKLNVPLQYNFYQSELAMVDQKVAVIISDGLRYEIAAELLRELNQETKTEAVIRSSLASIPSETQMGMSNLLPGKSFIFEDGKVTVDGILSDGPKNREKILRQTESDSIALSYTQLDGLSQADARQVFKSKLVYIYHDVIDAIGHKRASERNVLPMVASVIEDLKKLVKYLHTSMNVNRVLVTADHGFIYTDHPIQEKDYEPDMRDDINIDTQTNRYGFLEKEEKPESGHCFHFSKTSKMICDRYVVIPPSTNRYHRSGATVQYVHGGGSLQELIVPLIESRYRKNRPVEKVMPMLISRTLKVVSNSLKVQLIQEKSVTKDLKERTIQLGLYDGNDLVSNLAELKMNSTAEHPSQRMFAVDLYLNPGEGSKTRFSLRVFDPEDTLNRLIEVEVINNTLYESDF